MRLHFTALIMVVTVYVAALGQPSSARAYRIVMSEATKTKITQYHRQLSNGTVQPGQRVTVILGNVDPSTISRDEILEVLLATKKPLIFAESAVRGGGVDWTNQELSILGDIDVAVPVTVFDNGAWSTNDPNFAGAPAPISG